MTHGYAAEGDCAVQAEVKRRPRAFLLKDPVRTTLTATVCAQCGFTEIYAADPGELLSAHRARQSSAQGR